MLQHKKGHSTESGHHHLSQARLKREELEKRLGHSTKGLSDKDQAQLDNEFRNSIRMRKWQG